MRVEQMLKVMIEFFVPQKGLVYYSPYVQEFINFVKTIPIYLHYQRARVTAKNKKFHRKNFGQNR